MCLIKVFRNINEGNTLVLKNREEIFDAAKKLGLENDHASEIYNHVANENIAGVYVLRSNKIFIFADRQPNPVAVSFHENVHRAVNQMGGVANFTNLIDYLVHIDDELVSTIKAKYNEDDVDDEVIAYSLQAALIGGEINFLRDNLPYNAKEELNNILKYLGYEGTRNTREDVAKYEPNIEGRDYRRFKDRTRRAIMGWILAKRADLEAGGKNNRESRSEEGKRVIDFTDADAVEGYGGALFSSREMPWNEGESLGDALSRNLKEKARLEIEFKPDYLWAKKYSKESNNLDGELRFGSRVNNRMQEIESYYDGREMSVMERAIIDVFSGKRNNLTISVKTKDGNKNVVLRQGLENKAGAKHSLFRHYNTGVGVILADDLLLIPKIIAEGERSEKENRIIYELEQDGVKFKVLTSKDANKEIFNDFYTNKKSRNTRNAKSHEGYTHSAQNEITTYNGKGSDNNSTKQEYAEKINSSAESVEAEEGNLRFRIVDDPEEVAWFEDIA